MPDPTVRNVGLLAGCQAFANLAMTLNMTVTALAAMTMLEDKGWATAPLGLQFTATMLTTFPASLLMRRVGRRAGFAIGTGVGVSGAVLAIAALFLGNFVLFCLAAVLIGSFMGFVSFFRYAAADTASEAFKSKAISLVLAGGVISAVVAPTLADRSFEMLAPVTFAGTYVVMVMFVAAIWALLLFVQIPAPSIAKSKDTGRPLKQIVSNPVFFVAAAGAMIGYGAMTYVMTATPIAMLACGYLFTNTTSVIQWHVLGMFVPSFFTGHLIARFGVLQIMMVGAGMLVAAVLVNQSGIELMHFYAGLVLLGLGWNFLYIGGSTLLTQSYQPLEKAKVQGVFDTLIFATAASGSIMAGMIQEISGWQTVNQGVLPLIAIAIGLIFWMMFLQRRPAS